MTEQQRFEQAWRDLPPCVETDPLTMKTLADLRWSCILQLDLIEEGQDGTEADDPKAIRQWLKKYGKRRTPPAPATGRSE